MTLGLFEKLFIYRQRENTSPLENYLTELFAFCLETDIIFRNSFLNKVCNLNKNYFENFKISTQNEYEKLGRPDLEIEFDNYSILIESKVESKEGENQLKKYVEILESNKNKFDNKIIVYLTKYYEKKNIESLHCRLVNFRWFEIYNLINDSNKEITTELQKFLSAKNLKKNMNFDNNDILVLKTVPDTIQKMDEILNRIEPEMKKHFGACSTRASRSTNLGNNYYINFVELNYDEIPYSLNVGFNWTESEPLVWIAIEFRTKKFALSTLNEILKSELVEKNKWNFCEVENYSYYENYKSILEFNNEDSNSIDSISNYFNVEISSLLELRSKFPAIIKR